MTGRDHNGSPLTGDVPIVSTSFLPVPITSPFSPDEHWEKLAGGDTIGVATSLQLWGRRHPSSQAKATLWSPFSYSLPTKTSIHWSPDICHAPYMGD